MVFSPKQSYNLEIFFWELQKKELQLPTLDLHVPLNSETSIPGKGAACTMFFYAQAARRPSPRQMPAPTKKKQAAARSKGTRRVFSRLTNQNCYHHAGRRTARWDVTRAWSCWPHGHLTLSFFFFHCQGSQVMIMRNSLALTWNSFELWFDWFYWKPNEIIKAFFLGNRMYEWGRLLKRQERGTSGCLKVDGREFNKRELVDKEEMVPENLAHQTT